MTVQNLIRPLLGTVLVASATVSQAALFDCTIEEGFCIGEGDTVIFKFIGDTSSIGKFGNVEVRGDSIVSFPTDFRAESVDGEGTVSVDDNGTVQVIAKSGFQLESVNILERGDYLMLGAGASVDVDGYASVADAMDSFGAWAQQDLIIDGDLTIIDGNTHNWTGSTSFDLSGSLWDGINHIDLSLQNNLRASTSTDGIAWIEKKFTGASIDLSIVTIPEVPVPAAVWLFGSGLIGLAGFARRKQS